jgi:hypothetical protein
MRRLVPFIVLVLLPAVLCGCTESFAVRVDERTFNIEGPPVPGGADAPNRRVAERLCPKGYRVMDKSEHKVDPALGITTYWTIRCL